MLTLGVGRKVCSWLSLMTSSHIFDLTEMCIKKVEIRDQRIFFLALYSTHHGGKTFSRNRKFLKSTCAF